MLTEARGVGEQAMIRHTAAKERAFELQPVQPMQCSGDFGRATLACNTPATNRVLCLKDRQTGHKDYRTVVRLPPTPRSRPVLVTFDDERDDEAGVGVIVIWHGVA